MKKTIATIFLFIASAQAEDIVHYDKGSWEQIVFKPYCPLADSIVSVNKGQMEENTFKPYYPNNEEKAKIYN
ncbi:MAG: hypothetical protein PHQ22_03760 [Sulfuricurvum sp.]|nr:hypothetical protein [Sulfuricurvum sp.]MDD5386291.1 hypothetical protein [Sulfuricurvum sp.]